MDQMIHHMEMGHAYILGAERQTRGREVQWLPTMPLCRAVDQEEPCLQFSGRVPSSLPLCLGVDGGACCDLARNKTQFEVRGNWARLSHTQVPRGNFFFF